ncbi:MAG TPA: hypothetical protein VHJ19_02700 [Gammaproteobacteria bacterium]|nr:hypothetical protein [Gammaproteobacteria bacterium]
MRLMFLLAITTAVRSIRIGAAYFIPAQLSMGALLAARGRGVRIEANITARAWCGSFTLWQTAAGRRQDL